MIPNPRTVADMRNETVGVPGRINATRLPDGNVRLSHQFQVGDRTVTGAACILSPVAAQALADGIVSLLED